MPDRFVRMPNRYRPCNDDMRCCVGSNMPEQLHGGLHIARPSQLIVPKLTPSQKSAPSASPSAAHIRAWISDRTR
jgi:hypothetical protein